jgi:hypothetical protein
MCLIIYAAPLTKRSTISPLCATSLRSEARAPTPPCLDAPSVTDELAIADAVDLEHLPPPRVVMSHLTKDVGCRTQKSHRTDHLSISEELTVDSQLPSSFDPPVTAMTSARAPRTSPTRRLLLPSTPLPHHHRSLLTESRRRGQAMYGEQPSSSEPQIDSPHLCPALASTPDPPRRETSLESAKLRHPPMFPCSLVAWAASP